LTICPPDAQWVVKEWWGDIAADSVAAALQARTETAVSDGSFKDEHFSSSQPHAWIHGDGSEQGAHRSELGRLCGAVGVLELAATCTTSQKARSPLDVADWELCNRALID